MAVLHGFALGAHATNDRCRLALAVLANDLLGCGRRDHSRTAFLGARPTMLAT